MSPEDRQEILDNAKQDLEIRKSRDVALGYDWMVIDLLFQVNERLKEKLAETIGSAILMSLGEAPIRESDVNWALQQIASRDHHTP